MQRLIARTPSKRPQLRGKKQEKALTSKAFDVFASSIFSMNFDFILLNELNSNPRKERMVERSLRTPQ